MTNPFRQRDRARLYDAMVKEYRERGPVLFYPHLREEPLNTNVLRHPGNSWAGWFWRGFTDSLPATMWDAGSKQQFTYVCYRAGRDMALNEEGKP